MPDFPNFYENIKEANLRLNQTVVLYDNEPHFIMCITDHMPDGIFRVYMEPLKSNMWMRENHVPYEWHDEPNMNRGQKMDQYLSANKNCPIVRKHMNSPLFKKFRPFDLGMCHLHDGSLLYLERRPTRSTLQGLSGNAISKHPLSLTPTKRGSAYCDLFSDEVADCIKGVGKVTAKEAVEALNDPSVLNDGLAIDRNFAVVRGPVGFLFLAHKTDIVGLVSKTPDSPKVTVSNSFAHLKEAIQDLSQFNSVMIEGA
jgi:hypothetical protein